MDHPQHEHHAPLEAAMSVEGSALSVTGGVEAPPTLNPRFALKPTPRPNPKELVAKLREGDAVALARAITIVESSAPRDRALADEVTELCLPYSGNSIRIGITGVPGVGKSTFIESFGMHVVEEVGKKIAVLAIDPTSQITRGSILGDKSRMMRLSGHPSAFIRPSPAGSSLGGVAAKTRESMLLCEAAGYEVIVVETVGVGQSELAVHSMVDCFLLLMLAGAGDEMQGIKRGIMEMADIVAITKADGDNENNARVARQKYRNALHLFPPTPSNWPVPVLLSSAVNNMGIAELWQEILKFMDHENAGGFFDSRRAVQLRQWLHQSIESAVLTQFYEQPAVKEKIAFLEERVMKHEATVRAATASILKPPTG